MSMSMTNLSGIRSSPPPRPFNSTRISTLDLVNAMSALGTLLFLLGFFCAVCAHLKRLRLMNEIRNRAIEDDEGISVSYSTQQVRESSSAL